MPTAWDHALAALIALGLPLRALAMFRRVRDTPPDLRPVRRRALYTQAMLVQWSLVATLVGAWIAQGRAWDGLGMVWRPLGGFWGVLAGVALVVPFLLRQYASLSPAAAESARRQFESLEAMLPHTRSERSHFFALAVTAGICEELLFRGFLIWYVAHWTGVLQAIGITSVAFGLGHAYQGVGGMWKTGLVGAFMGLVYLLSGSIWLPMLLHALVDVYSGAVIQRVYELGAAASAPGDAGAAPA